MPKPNKLSMRILDKNDAKDFKEIRLEALQAHPEAFLGSYDSESKEPIEFFEQHITTDKVVGCFKENRLMGIAGYYIMTPKGKRAHTAKIWGFYIRPEYRGRGFAKKLLQSVLDEAEKKAEKVLLKVYRRNKPAIRLYKALGFKVYGLEIKSLKIGETYYDDYLMCKFFSES